jgi:hypothetical protein
MLPPDSEEKPASVYFNPRISADDGVGPCAQRKRRLRFLPFLGISLYSTHRWANRAPCPPTAREGGFPRAGLAYFPFDLSQAERMNMSGFSAAAGVDNANSTRAAERLTSLGHVIKTPDEQDGRACRISLTASGRKVAERVVATGPQWGKLTAAGVCPSNRIPAKGVFD